MIAAIKTAMAHRSFRNVIRAAQSALVDGNHALSLEYCGKALALANKRNDAVLRGKVMTAMNRVRAEGRRAEPRRYAPIPACESAMINETKIMMLAAGALVVLSCMAVGVSIPLQMGANYDLIQYTGEETDIVDYNLTADDCARFETTARRNGFVVSCELAAK